MSSLILGCHSGADDPYDVIVTLGVDHYDDASLDRADGNETIFVIGMFLVVDLQVVDFPFR